MVKVLFRRSLKPYELLGWVTVNLVLSEESKNLDGLQRYIMTSNDVAKCSKTMLCESHTKF